MIKNKITLFVIACCLLTMGCTKTIIHLPNGISLTTDRKFDYTKIGEVTLEFNSPETNFVVRLKGYDSDREKALQNAAPIAEAIAEGVAKGLVKGAVPIP